MPKSIREYLTIGGAAELLGVSVDTLRNWDRDGKLEAVRHPINGYRLYDRRRLESLLDRMTKPSRRPGRPIAPR